MKQTREFQNVILAVALTGVTSVLFSATPTPAHLSIIRQGPESAGTAIPNERYGNSLSVADFNGDGFDDLAVGAEWEDILGVSQAGAVVVSYGSGRGLTHVGAATHDVRDFGFSPQDGARFATALAGADLNNDGYDDLMVGAPRETVGGVSEAGRVYFYAGGPEGLTPWFEFIQEDVGGVSLHRDHFGFSIVADQFDSDTHRDLAIGSPSRSTDGKVFYVRGTATGPFGTTTIFDSDVLGYPPEAGDQFGAALAAGNVIGNYRRDLVVGAPRRTIGIKQDAGACYIIRGSDSGTGLGTAGAFVLDAGMAESAQEDGRFGSALAVGKFLGPGIYDYIAIGEPRRNVSGEPLVGRVHGIQGSLGGPILSSATTLYQSDFGLTENVADEFGTSLSGGYFGEDTLWEDLVIGTPNDRIGTESKAGSGVIAYGAATGPGTTGYTNILGQELLGDVSDENDLLGAAVAIGQFDASGWGALAISSMGDDDNRGMVQIFAPWRQPNNYRCKSSLVVDCNGDFIFSQKPFEEVPVANQSLIMAALLACERTQLPTSHPDYISLTATVVVPNLVVSRAYGHGFLIDGEVTTLGALLYTSILAHGGDSGLTLAYLLFPGDSPLTDFTDAMNERAQQLGMYNTNFIDPAIFDPSSFGDPHEDHYSSAYDLYLLSRAARDNPLLREILDTDIRYISRAIPDAVPTTTTFLNTFLSTMQNSIANSSGLKRSWTLDSGTSLAYSATQLLGTTYVTSLGTPIDEGDQQTAVDLMAIGLRDCSLTQVDVWDGIFTHVEEGLEALAETTTGIFTLFETTSGDYQFELFSAPGGGDANVEAAIRMERNSYLDLGEGELSTFGISPLGLDEGTRVTNAGQSFAAVRLNGVEYDLDNGQAIVLPPRGDSEEWVVENLGKSARLLVEENYSFALDYSSQGGGEPSGSIFSATLLRRPNVKQDSFEFWIDWQSTGGEFFVAIHDAAVVVDVPDGPDIDPMGQPKSAVSRVYPNPSQGKATIQLILSQHTDVGLHILDAAGRKVRSFPAKSTPAGESTLVWDGRSDRGDPVAAGVYFYQFELNGSRKQNGRIVRIE